jgi:hypothetical protein
MATSANAITASAIAISTIVNADSLERPLLFNAPARNLI